MHKRPQDKDVLPDQSEHCALHRPSDRGEPASPSVMLAAGDDPDPAKVLVVGDTHGAVAWMRNRVIPHAIRMGCQRIFQVGDFGFVWDNDFVAVDRELGRLDIMLARAGLTLHFLPGKNDNHKMLAALAAKSRTNREGHYVLRPAIYYTGRVSSWTWRNIRFAAVGGAVGVDSDPVRGVPHPAMLTQEEVFAAEQIGPVDVLFSHDAPTEMPTLALRLHVPTTHSRETMSRIGWALQPRMWTHGRYHRSLTYQFRHRAGLCAVRGLDMDGSQLTESTAVLDLDLFRTVSLGRSA